MTNKARPRVSILLPVHNGAPYLKGCLDSLWAQSFEQFECLALNDGSTDETEEILSRVRDPRLVHVPLRRCGLTKTLNTGLEMARGEFIARQDVDDFSMPDRLKVQVRALEASPRLTLVGSDALAINSRGRVIRKIVFPVVHREIVERLLVLNNPFAHTAIMFRKDPILRCGGYREIIFKAEDYDLYLRLSEGHELANIHKPLVKVLCSMESVSCSDQQGQQFKSSVLALVSALSRRGHAKDPLEERDKDKFLAEFDAWYASTQYSDWFRAIKYRRQTLLALSEGRFGPAFSSLMSSLRAHPGWLLNRAMSGSNDWMAKEAIQWAQTHT
ncbi:MAG TPA: glycosyltransferase [Candidatus Angelobacter sp.]|nr:glycosyltransferase [Candidatus Angelobacter sp.]